MSISKRGFRALVVASVAAVALGAVLHFATQSSLPAPLAEHLRAQDEAELTAQDLALMALSLPLLLASLISVVGLLLFWRFSRPLALVSAVLGEILLPFFGPTVESGWVSMFDDWAGILWGAVLALAYFSPAREWFEKRLAPVEAPAGDLRSRWSG